MAGKVSEHLRIEGGHDASGKPIYVCTSYTSWDDGTSHPGSLWDDKCYVGWGGKQYEPDYLTMRYKS